MTKFDGKEAGITVVRSLFSAVPFAGGALNEVFFDYRSRVKQNRINTFSELLSEFFLEHQEIDPESLKTEEFSDIFESVVRRVVMTKSKQKHERYRDVLIQHIYEPHKSAENAETYLDLISALDEMAIRILSEHARFSVDFARLEVECMKADSRSRQTQEKIDKLKISHPVDDTAIAALQPQLDGELKAADTIRQQITDRQEFRKAEYFQISASEFLYYKQTLYAKGLLIDKGFGTFGGSQPFTRMWTTDFGDQFIRFLLA
ncbi:hypothetical protein [Mucilaginibacter ginsenosidivorax]|uniref:Uncharacterized protein n=1 Tax=Mucilaginibacter ginsenosidivorax TaxID=862126 RepID=A0A5B8W5K2_9SPHI|nr:hypothetical protein [Mucilaginibacter ginsenosidivorax]QEC78961.1 hypothetical protein FSB76_24545 [Mucilaginibacter ginsenosidivorax]